MRTYQHSSPAMTILHWLEERWQGLAVLIGIGVVSFGLLIVLSQNHAQKEGEASTRYSQLPEVITAENSAQFETFVGDFGDSSAGKMATLKMARFYFSTGEHDKSLTLVMPLASGRIRPDLVVIFSRELVAAIAEANSDFEKAATYYGNLYKIKENPFRDMARIHQARNLKLAGQIDQAKEIYTATMNDPTVPDQWKEEARTNLLALHLVQ